MILGLAGKALSGKDTIADYVLNAHGWDRKVGFATNLKVACMEIFSLTEEQVFSQQGKSSKFTSPVVIEHKTLLEIIGWMRKTHDVALQNKSYKHLYGRKMNSPRDVLQFVGTEVMRYYAPDYHKEVVFRGVCPNEKVIISDVRFPNEALSVLENNGILVKVTRRDSLRTPQGFSLDTGHDSETALNEWGNWSYIIKNDGSFIDLYEDIDKMILDIGDVK